MKNAWVADAYPYLRSTTVSALKIPALVENTCDDRSCTMLQVTTFLEFYSESASLRLPSMFLLPGSASLTPLPPLPFLSFKVAALTLTLTRASLKQTCS